MAIVQTNTKSSASLVLAVDADHEVRVPISGLVSTPDRDKLWALAKVIAKPLEHEIKCVNLSETVKIDEA